MPAQHEPGSNETTPNKLKKQTGRTYGTAAADRDVATSNDTANRFLGGPRRSWMPNALQVQPPPRLRKPKPSKPPEAAPPPPPPAAAAAAPAPRPPPVPKQYVLPSNDVYKPRTAPRPSVLPSPAPSDEPSPAVSMTHESPNPAPASLPDQRPMSNSGSPVAGVEPVQPQMAVTEAIFVVDLPEAASNAVVADRQRNDERLQNGNAAAESAAGQGTGPPELPSLGPPSTGRGSFNARDAEVEIIRTRTRDRGQGQLGGVGHGAPGIPQPTALSPPEVPRQPVWNPNMLLPSFASADPQAQDSEPSAKRRRTEAPQAPQTTPTLPELDTGECLAVLDDYAVRNGGMDAFGRDCEHPRLVLLQEACQNGDVFFLALHQLFCLWARDAPAVHAVLTIEPGVADAGFSVMEMLLKRSNIVRQPHLEWMCNFPAPLSRILESVKAEGRNQSYQQAIAQVASFLERGANAYSSLTQAAAGRKYPFLVDELLGQLGCRSRVLQRVLFRVSRRKLGVPEGQIAAQLEEVFGHDQRIHQDGSGVFRPMAPIPDVNELERRNARIIALYKELVGHAVKARAREEKEQKRRASLQPKRSASSPHPQQSSTSSTPGPSSLSNAHIRQPSGQSSQATPTPSALTSYPGASGVSNAHLQQPSGQSSQPSPVPSAVTSYAPSPQLPPASSAAAPQQPFTIPAVWQQAPQPYSSQPFPFANYPGQPQNLRSSIPNMASPGSSGSPQQTGPPSGQAGQAGQQPSGQPQQAPNSAASPDLGQQEATRSGSSTGQQQHPGRHVQSSPVTQNFQQAQQQPQPQAQQQQPVNQDLTFAQQQYQQQQFQQQQQYLQWQQQQQQQQMAGFLNQQQFGNAQRAFQMSLQQQMAAYERAHNQAATEAMLQYPATDPQLQAQQQAQVQRAVAHHLGPQQTRAQRSLARAQQQGQQGQQGQQHLQMGSANQPQAMSPNHPNPYASFFQNVMPTPGVSPVNPQFPGHPRGQQASAQQNLASPGFPVSSNGPMRAAPGFAMAGDMSMQQQHWNQGMQQRSPGLHQGMQLFNQGVQQMNRHRQHPEQFLLLPPLDMPLLPPPGHAIQLCDFPHDPNDHKAILAGLHQADVRSPRRKVAQSAKERHYQAVHSLPVPPSLIPPARHLYKYHFSVSTEQYVRQPQIAYKPHSLPVATHFDGSLRWRVRTVKLPPRQEQPPAEHEWAVTDTYWPEQIQIALNDHTVAIRRRAQNGRDEPSELTPFIRPGPNELVVAVIGPRNLPHDLPRFALAVELVETRSLSAVLAHIHAQGVLPRDQTLTKIQSRLAASSSILNSDDDDSLQMVAEELSIDLADPFSRVMFATPVRGAHCTHMECFDLDNWLETRPAKPVRPHLNSPGLDPEPSVPDKWRCPICDADARPNSLRIDSFLVEVRKQLVEQGKKGAKRILVAKDGTWKPVVQVDDEEDEDDDGEGDKVENRSGTPGVPAGAKKPVEVIELLDD